MARVFMDGFDSYSSNSDPYTQTYSGGGLNLNTTAGRFGGGALQGPNASTGYAGIVGTFALELWKGIALYSSDNSSSNHNLCSFSSPAGVEGMITINTVTNVATLWRGSTSTSLGTVLLPSLNNKWHWLDVHFKYDGSAGIFELWMDGVQLIDLTGQNTAQNSSQTVLNMVAIGSPSGTILNAYFDDWIINDTTGSINNGRVGDQRIETLVPTSDATPNNGTCSTGTTHYAMVNESQWNTSNYITMTNTSGQEELFGMADLSGTPATVSAVKVIYIGEKTDAGVASLETVLVSGGVGSNGASTPMLTSWARQGATYELDPNTAAAWAYTAVNAMQAGWKVP